MKLLQIVKMKRSAVKPNVDFLVSVLNENKIFSQTPEGPAKNFFVGLFEHAKASNVFFSEKELFILGNEVHIYNAIFGVELYKLSQKLRLFDTTLATSLETFAVHTDYLTEYALTLGKTSQGVTNFKNNLQALSDKSKLLNSTGAPDKELQAKLQLNRVYQLQTGLHERLIQLSQMVANEMNNDYGSLFQEKKYKELIQFAREQSDEQLQVFSL